MKTRYSFENRRADRRTERQTDRRTRVRNTLFMRFFPMMYEMLKSYKNEMLRMKAITPYESGRLKLSINSG